jgi:hypothetical protein
MKKEFREYILAIKLQQMYIGNNGAQNEEWGLSKPQNVYSRNYQLEELSIDSCIKEIDWYKNLMSLLGSKRFNTNSKLEILLSISVSLHMFFNIYIMK